LPHALAITAANVTDRNGALLAFEHNKDELTEVKSILCDGGYSGKPFADGVKAVLGEEVTVQVVKRNELHTFKVIPKRWVVERSFAWLEKQRRLWDIPKLPLPSRFGNWNWNLILGFLTGWEDMWS